MLFCDPLETVNYVLVFAQGFYVKNDFYLEISP